MELAGGHLCQASLLALRPPGLAESSDQHLGNCPMALVRADGDLALFSPFAYPFARTSLTQLCFQLLTWGVGVGAGLKVPTSTWENS